ncbi:THO2 plays a role in transcriptional elongation [Coniothyrium glycines]
MAPGPKRKRPDRTYSQDDDRNPRPSPHRPQNLPLGHQYQQNHSPRGGGVGRRQSRGGGRGGASVSQSFNVAHASPTVMSSPATSFQSGKPVQPSQPPAAPAVQPPSSLQISRRVPESNEYLTSARVKHWSSEARDAVVQAALSAQSNGDILVLSVIFHEIIEASMENSLDASELGSMVRDITSATSNELVDPVSTFLDTMSSLTLDEKKQSLVRELLVATDIDTSRMRAELEEKLLRSLGLVRDSFPKMAVRKATHALYRQMNYNLLREETEGYAKLMTEYFTTTHNEPPSQEVVSETYQRVNALIGAFDLDIGRVLDVTLDVFANLLIKHGKFFVKLLRSSAWWPELRGPQGIDWEESTISTLPQWAQPDSALWYYTEEEKDRQLKQREIRDRNFWQRVGELGDRAGIQAFFELGGRRIIADNRQPDHTKPVMGTQPSKQQAARKWGDEWMELTKTLPPSGNDIAAQLLGFKLRFYASDNRDANDRLPENLIYLAALLIKIGFISILDLYPHLYPPEEDMGAHKEKLLKIKKEREQKERGGVANALTMAGALPDEGLPPTVTRLREAESRSKTDSERSTPAKTDEATDSKKTLEEPADQKAQLLKALLTIGALPESLFILGRHPWLLEVYPELIELISRLAHHSISKIYESAKPLATTQVDPTYKGAGLRTPMRPSDFVPRKTLRWGKPDQRHGGDGSDYKFYWEDWSDNVPVCQEVDDVIKLCNTLLGLVGPECGQDIILLTKIIRIGKKSLADDASDANKKRWINFSATFIAPALSFTGRNPGIITEVWDLFKQFDTATRYNIYQQWFSGNKPAIRAAFADVQAKTKHELSRISATNTKEYGRKIAKISYSSPGVVFKMTVKQLVAYPNMIDALVECSRYLTLLGYDCLTWTLVTFFLNPDKGSTQDDGMLSAPWLKNIASFVGKAYQKYHLMDPIPILQFTANQFLRTEGELYMLDVLEQMVQSMGGIKVSGSLSESMILALSSGPVLRTFTLQHHLSDHRHQAGSSARRLVRCLKDTGLAPQLLIALAQHVEAYPHREDRQEAPDKVVLFNIDKLRSNLVQYLELLRAYLSADEFDGLFPSLIEMIADYGVEPDVAFTVARASITAKANAFRRSQDNALQLSDAVHNGDVVMVDSGSEATIPGVASTNLIKNETDGTAKDVDMGDALPTAQSDMNAERSTPVSAAGLSLPDTPNVEIEKLAQDLKISIPDLFADHPCVGFYITFWQLSLPDVDDGGIKQQYRDTIAYFERQIPAPIPERRGYRPNVPKKESEEARRAKMEISKLKDEQTSIENINATTQEHLRVEMRRWFDGVPMVGARSDTLHNALLQDCFIPRSRMTLQDAQYAAAILTFMHKSGVPGFRTIKLLDLLFNSNKLTCIISMYTEDESRAFGRFLSEVLRELQRWHVNKDGGYAKSAHGAEKQLPGFGKRFDSERRATDFLKYEEFCMLLYKWHKALFTALKTCLESSNWMQIRNSVNVLKALNPTFPKVDAMATDLRQTIKSLAESDARPDLKTSLLSILGDFNKSKRFWQKEHEFRNLPAPPTPPASTIADDTATEGAKTPRPQTTSASSLKPTALAFNPKTEVNGVKATSTAPTDEHDSKRAESPSVSLASVSRDTETTKISSDLPETRVPATFRSETPSSRNSAKPGPPMHPSSMPSRPDNRNAPAQSSPAGRPSHTLPTRPDAQPQRGRQSDRPTVDRPFEPATHGRYDDRGPPSDYGRLDRPGEINRHRDASPGRRLRQLPGDGRTPERLQSSSEAREWSGIDSREYDDRAMRAPLRDTRPHGARPMWDPRENRDQRDPRDLRERPDSRGPGAPSNSNMDSRRMTSNPLMPQEQGVPRRDVHQPHHESIERNEGSSRPSPSPAAQAGSGPTLNPARAALINEEVHGRHDTTQPDRDYRREKGPRPQSPHRVENRHNDARRVDDHRYEERAPYGYAGRNEMPREYRDDRMHGQFGPPGGREYRDEHSAPAPTGPRSGRSEAPSSSRGAREMFQSSQGPRLAGSQAQDPNYGRLSQPSDSMPPSGPRSDRPQAQSQPPTPTAPLATPSSVGIHPSRLENIHSQTRGPSGPPVQTNMSSAPSGPRGSGRAPQGTIPSSPVNRGPPTGPAAGGRNGGNPLRAINNVLVQGGSPNERPLERNGPSQNPPVRGRGASRVNGPMDVPAGMASPMPPPHFSAQNARVEGQQSRGGRSEYHFEEEARSESRGHRESRRSERSGLERSSDRSDRRHEERSNRGGPGEVEQERGSDRERGRDKRADRESKRDRESERLSRESERPGRESRDPKEPREGSRRDKGPRDDGRLSGRDERDRRSRGGGPGNGGPGNGGPDVPPGDDGRKRGRDLMDQSQGHPDPKRRR